MLDLASWEIVREHRAALMDVLKDGLVACCVCNEVGVHSRPLPNA
jgi:hypothetical protein